MSETPRSAPSPTDAARPQVRQPRQMPTPASIARRGPTSAVSSPGVIVNSPAAAVNATSACPMVMGSLPLVSPGLRCLRPNSAPSIAQSRSARPAYLFVPDSSTPRRRQKNPSLADLNSDCDDSADEKKRSACYNLAVRVALPAQPQCFSILVSGSANEKSQLQCDRSNAKGLKHESRNSLCSSVGLTLCLHRVGSQFHPAARPGTTSPCRSLGLRAHLQSYRRRPH